MLQILSPSEMSLEYLIFAMIRCIIVFILGIIIMGAGKANNSDNPYKKATIVNFLWAIVNLFIRLFITNDLILGLIIPYIINFGVGLIIIMKLYELEFIEKLRYLYRVLLVLFIIDIIIGLFGLQFILLE